MQLKKIDFLNRLMWFPPLIEPSHHFAKFNIIYGFPHLKGVMKNSELQSK